MLNTIYVINSLYCILFYLFLLFEQINDNDDDDTSQKQFLGFSSSRDIMLVSLFTKFCLMREIKPTTCFSACCIFFVSVLYDTTLDVWEGHRSCGKIWLSLDGN